jgi:phospholipase C
MYRPGILSSSHFSVSLKLTLVASIALLGGCGGSAKPPAQPLVTPVTVPDKPSSPLAATIILTATPQVLVPGSLVTLSWVTTNAKAITFTPALPEKEDREPALPSDSWIFPINQTTTYTATVEDAAGNKSSSSVTITVVSAQFNFSVEPDTIHPGESATLKWTSEKISGLSIDNGIGDVSFKLPNGSVTVSPVATTTYTATATVQAGVTLTGKVVVSVVAPPPPPPNPIRHIIVMLQENRTFDNYFGRLGPYRAAKVAGASPGDVDGFDPNTALRTKTGKSVRPYHYQTVCTEGLDFAWNESHIDMNLQAPATFMDSDFSKAKFLMDGFPQTLNLTTIDPDGTRQMGYYDERDLPYYYELATQFATSDRFYSSVPTNTLPNRMYMFTATSFGNVRPASPPAGGWPQKTIFRALNDAGVSWRYYYQDADIYFTDFADYYRPEIKPKVYKIDNWFSVLASPTADRDLPAVVFIERAGSTGLDEHPDKNIQKGAASVQQIISALMNSPAWQSSVFILSYDEGGGLYDHVPPFQVAEPDDISPILQSNDVKGRFNLSGFRIPITVISPWVKPHLVSHIPREHASILKFIEARFNMPPLTRRDAGADDMSEFFDFAHAAWLNPPTLPAQPTDGLCDWAREAGPTFN